MSPTPSDGAPDTPSIPGAVQNMGNSVRAYMHFLGRLYEATADLYRAYQVDTGREVEVMIPAWDSLTMAQKQLWSASVAPVRSHLHRVIVMGFGMVDGELQ